MLDQVAAHVDETGWRTAYEGRALWTLTTPGSALFQIAEHCSGEQFQALIGHLSRDRCLESLERLCAPGPAPAPSLLVAHPARLPPPPRRPRRAEDFRRARAGADPPRVRRVARLPARAAEPRQARDKMAPIQIGLRRLLQEASLKSARSRWHRRLANNLLKVWPALWTFVTSLGDPADQQPRRTCAPEPGHPPKTLRRHPQPWPRTLRRTRPIGRRHLPPKAAHCSLTSANSSPPTTATTCSALT